MRVDDIALNGRTLVVRCSGVFGVGSASADSGRRIMEAISKWMAENPDVPVTDVDVDLIGVEYTWGDGPVSGLIGLLLKGVGRIRILAGAANQEALQNLVRTCRVPQFEVVSRDDQ